MQHVPRHAATASGWRRMSEIVVRRDRHLDLADEIRAAANDLFDCVDELHYSHDWPYEHAEQRAFDAVQRARKLVSRNGRMTQDEMLAALIPVTHEWWPERSPLVADARDAVERIRRAAIVAAYEPRSGLAWSDALWRDVA
jgi:hypothetical protein